MHIAVVAADLLPKALGGAEVHLVELVKRLAKKGHSFDVFVGPGGEIAKVFSTDVTVHPVSYPKVPNLYGISYIVFSPLQIKRALRGKKIDLVWAKQVFPQGVVAAILANHLKKPLYTTAQNPLDYKEELVLKGPLPLKSLWPRFLTPLVSYALRRSNLVACVSHYAEKQALKLGAKRTTLIPNGVDTKKFKTQNSKLKAKKKARIISTSALIPRNGLDTLIETVSLLPKSMDWELVIAGDGPEKENLKSQISNLKLENRVKLLGRVENHKIPALLKAADLFVRLSRKEGFGVSFVEAMASGVPVIATPVGGITDFIKDGVTGLLVEPDNPRRARAAIERFLTDTKLYQKLRHNGRALVEKRYNWERIADEVENAFVAIT